MGRSVLLRTAAAFRPQPPSPTMAAAASSYDGPHGTDFLHGQIRALLAFYDPIVKDEALGGFNNQLRDDGTVYDAQSKHCVGTARFTVNYALASLLYGEAPHKDLAAHGVSFLMERQQDTEHGGFAWVLNGHEVEDGEKWCCEHLLPPSRCRPHPPSPSHLGACPPPSDSVAFGLLALANAHKAGVAGAEEHIKTVHTLAEERYYEPEHGITSPPSPPHLLPANPYS